MLSHAELCRDANSSLQMSLYWFVVGEYSRRISQLFWLLLKVQLLLLPLFVESVEKPNQLLACLFECCCNSGLKIILFFRARITLVGDRGDFYCSEWEWINKTSSKYEGKKGAFGLFSKPFTFDYALTSKRTVMKPICHLTHAELATKVTYRFFRHSHSLQSDSPRSLLNKPTSV